MNTRIPQPFAYPFSPPMPWLPVPFRLPVSYPTPSQIPPFVLPQQPHGFSRKRPSSSSSSLSNTRYHQMKQLRSYSHHPKPAETRSMSNLEQISRSSSARLLKTHASNLSVAYAHELHLIPKSRRRRSLRQKARVPQPLPPPPPPQRKASFRRRRIRPPLHLPERGVVRISTLDEIPMVSHPIHQDRISTKGSISNSSQHRIKVKDKKRRTNSIDSRSLRTEDQRSESIRLNSDGHSSSSSSSSSNYRSPSAAIQQRLNGSLRNDPLIIAAMEDYRQLRRSNSQTTSLNSQPPNSRRDSLRSNSTSRSSSSSARHSQSSFTSVERSEIRQLVQTLKTKDSKPLDTPIQSSPIPASPTPSELSVSISSAPSELIRRPKKSPLTEELDREFSKLRARDPDQDNVNVIPSLICKRRRTPEKPVQSIPPLPTFNELLRQVQLRPIEKTIQSLPLKEKPIEHSKENSIISIPVPCSSPIPTEEVKHEYAVPIKQNTNRRYLPHISHFQPSHHAKFNRSVSKLLPEKRTPRSSSMLNWFQQNLTHPFPSTFQPSRIHHQTKESLVPSVTENIYTSTIEADSPVYDQNLQLHLENQTILTDDSYSDDETKHRIHLFTRKHKHENLTSTKHQRCSIM